MTPEVLNRARDWIADEFINSLTQATDAMFGTPCLLERAVEWRSKSGEGELAWWAIPFSCGVSSELWVGGTAESAVGVGQAVLRGAGVEDSEEDDARSTYFEVLHQAASGLAQSLTSLAGREVTFTPGRVSPPQAEEFCALSLTFESEPLDLLLGVSSEMVHAVAALQSPPDPPTAPPPAAPAQTTSAVAAGPPAEAISGSVDLILDVDLPVSVSFGRAVVPLKEVLKLTSGSIVELNRSVTEPVDVIVNNCLIARGEVVVIEGNYGVRIQQIVSRHERLRSMQ